jgi:hypothetical protein
MTHLLPDSKCLHGEVALHVFAKRELLDQYPDLDNETLADTLDGLTDFNEILAAFVRSALDDEALATALSTRLADMKARLDRLTHRAKTKRSLVLDAMTKADLKRLIAPDFTVSVRKATPYLEVIEEARIPEDYWKPQPAKLDRQGLISDLRNGAVIAGAQLGPRTSQLSVRVK